MQSNDKDDGPEKCKDSKKTYSFGVCSDITD